jgi:putative endonuclease
MAAILSSWRDTLALREHCYYVYILANKQRRLYAGVTNSLMTRVAQHKRKDDPNSFTARYGIDRLVYFERFQYVQNAIAREKEIKGWLRAKKIALIVSTNPKWRDLSEDWGKPIEPFDESKMRSPESF